MSKEMFHFLKNFNSCSAYQCVKSDPRMKESFFQWYSFMCFWKPGLDANSFFSGGQIGHF